MTRSKGRHIMPLIPPGRVAAPPRIEAHTVLAAAEAAQRDGQLAVALRGYQILMQQLGPDHPIGIRACYMTALACFQQRNYVEAVLLMEAVREKAWSNPDVHYNLGLFYHQSARVADAADAYRTALALNPAMFVAENNLGNALRELGDLETSELCFQRLLSRNPDSPEARYNLAHVTLLRGDLARGFELYESRWQCDGWNAEYRRLDITSPLLTPEMSGRRVLVHQEQGIGDTLQFMRFLPALVARGHHVWFECPTELSSWLQDQHMPGVTFTKRGAPLPEHDAHISLLSIPAFVGVSSEADIPPIWKPEVRRYSPLPYDKRDQRRVVGVVWAGNPNHHNDRHRSANVEQLAALWAMEDTRFVSIQLGARGVELLSALPRIALGEGSEIIDISASLRDFEATAALVLSCDAVVCVDTSVAHLAGTLGVPTLILTSWLSEWRWQLERLDSPWYPSATLVRQPTLGDWAATARQARTLLEAL